MPGVYFVEESKRVRQFDAPLLICSAQLSSFVTFLSVHTALAAARRTWVYWQALACGIC